MAKIQLMAATRNQQLVVMMIPMFAMLGLLVSIPPVRAQELPPAAPEAKPVPKGIKGARFGMNPKELTRKLPYLVDKIETNHDSVSYENTAVDFPGMQLEAKTTIGSEQAHCIFLFTTANGLVRIECTFRFRENKFNFDQARKGLLKVLKSKYGNPGSISEPFACEDRGLPGDEYGFMPATKDIRCAGWWIWKDDGARLEVKATSSDYSTAISIINESPEYQRALERTALRAKKLYRQEQDELRRKEQILKRNIRRFDQDL